MKSEQYFIIRTDRAGVFYAQIAARHNNPNGTDLDLVNARKVHGWDGACGVEELAEKGPQKQGGNNRWTITVPSMTVMSAIQIIPVSDEAQKVIEAIPEWKRS